MKATEKCTQAAASWSEIVTATFCHRVTANYCDKDCETSGCSPPRRHCGTHLESYSQILERADAMLSPVSLEMEYAMRSAMPVPAMPAPLNRNT